MVEGTSIVRMDRCQVLPDVTDVLRIGTDQFNDITFISHPAGS
jgi:hypothetical protein